MHDVTKSYMSKRFTQLIGRLIEFKATEFTDMISNSTLQITLKKLPLVFWYTII